MKTIIKNRIETSINRIVNASISIILCVFISSILIMPIVNAIFKISIMKSWGVGLVIMFIIFCLIATFDHDLDY